jgi:hypothetical protein
MSDKPLAERLQVKKGRRLAVLAAPRGVDALIGAGAARAGAESADVVLLFAADRRQLDAALPRCLKKAPETAILWVAYPKLTSALAADLSRDVIRSIAPGYGLDTVAQIAIDDDWSALRLKRVG